jgi:hypothetical protein
MSQTQTDQKTKRLLRQTQIDQKTKKLLRLVKVSARLGRDRENYRKALSALARSMPRETRAIIAKYAVALRKAVAEPTPENIRVLGELAVEKAKEVRSWKIDNREKREIVSQIAKRFYANLTEVTKIAEELEKEFEEELAGIE